MSKPTIAFELKNNLPNLTIMKIYSIDCDKIQKEVRQKKREAPLMLVGLQTVLDLSELEQDQIKQINYAKLRKMLLDESIIPIAIMTDYKLAHTLAVDSGLGAIPYLKSSSKSTRIIPKHKLADDDASINNKVTEKTDVTNNRNSPINTPVLSQLENKIIYNPIRSGQRVYAKGDLTIVGNVSPGSEVIADGNIHVYGALNGRAIAGASGDEGCQIFCLQMNAELVSIAGNYKQFEEEDNEYLNKRARISLNNEKICFFLL